ncbi:MAG: hypothetical protein ACFCUO_12375 [Rhodospirillales bacterium]
MFGFRTSLMVVALVAGGFVIGGAMPGGSPDLAAAGAVGGLIAAILVTLGRTR